MRVVAARGAAVGAVVAALAAVGAPAASASGAPGASGAAGALASGAAGALASGAPLATPALSLAGRQSTIVVTPRDGVRRIGDLRMTAPGDVPTWAEAREQMPPPNLPRRCGEPRYPGGLRLLFTSFGGASCPDLALQTAELRGDGWLVEVGSRTYSVGMRVSELPRRARRLPRSWGGGVQLASMPFIGSRTPTVVAHGDGRSPQRVGRISIFVGGAGD